MHAIQTHTHLSVYVYISLSSGVYIYTYISFEKVRNTVLRLERTRKYLDSWILSSVLPAPLLTEKRPVSSFPMLHDWKYAPHLTQ